MTHIAFFEPEYAAHNTRDWEIRGSYKYPSLIGKLREHAAITVLMRTLPPAEDRHRQTLESEYGVRFVTLDTLEDAGGHVADILIADYAAAIREHAPTLVSTLNGRMIGNNFALARAARETGAQFIYRVAGNDIATRTAVLEAAGRPVESTAFRANLVAQERYAAEVARTVIVMGGTEKIRAEKMVSDRTKIQICRRGVDRTHFTPPAELAHRCDHILFVGRNSEEKGIDLIEAAATILAEVRPGISFTIAGDFESREEGNRRYLGFHDYDALPKLYHDHQALVLPARSEGFPQVVMEAMTCGLPAVLSQSLFAQDFGAEDGVALVDLNPRAIADAIVSWHDDPALFAIRQTLSLAHAEGHFDAAKNGALYHQALLGELV